MDCSVISGMELTQVDDDRTHIRYSISTTFNMTGDLVIGSGAVRILYQPTAVDGSITSLSEQHPISVSVSGQAYETESFSPWFLQEETISLSLKEEINNENENLVDTSIFSTWWFISLTVSSILIIGFLALKLKNKEDTYSINLDDEEDEDDEETLDYDDEETLDYDDEIEDTSFGEIEEMETSLIPNEEISENSTPRIRSRTVRAERVQNSIPVTRKKRTRATEEESTVKVAKRRRLVQDDSKPVVRKRRAVRQSSDVEDVEMSDVLNRYEDN
jgi:hypothetical protein